MSEQLHKYQVKINIYETAALSEISMMEQLIIETCNLINYAPWVDEKKKSSMIKIIDRTLEQIEGCTRVLLDRGSIKPEAWIVNERARQFKISFNQKLEDIRNDEDIVQRYERLGKLSPSV